MFLSGLRDRVRSQRWHRVLALSALTGALTGFAIVGFEALTSRVLLDWVFEWPRAAQVAAPTIGLVLAWAALHWLGRDASPSTSDEYLRAYHDPQHPFEARAFPGRVLASIDTLGFGGALGFEGPSIYIGAGIGSWIERRLGWFVTRDDLRLMLVAGAAAGVSAIFKAPATGAVFAIEVPFQEDTAAHAQADVGSGDAHNVCNRGDRGPTRPDRERRAPLPRAAGSPEQRRSCRRVYPAVDLRGPAPPG